MPGHRQPQGAAGLRLPPQPDPELAVPCSWLLSHRVNAQVLLLQHPDFQRAQPTAKEPGALGGDADLSAKQQQSKKKKKRTRRPRPPRGTLSQDTLGEQSWSLQPHKLGWAGLARCVL